jgi:hypothetical protein
VRAASEQFSARFGCLLCLSVVVTSEQPHTTHHILVCALDALEAGSVLFQLTPKVLQSLKRLLLLGLHRLLLGELAVVVDGARERCQRGIELRLEMW